MGGGAASERNEVLYESSVLETPLQNVYQNGNTVEPQKHSIALMKSSSCNKSTTSLESMVPDLLSSQMNTTQDRDFEVDKEETCLAPNLQINLRQHSDQIASSERI